MQSEETPPTEDDVRSALARLQDSDAIAQKPGLRDILGYVVEEELAGRGDRLKAYTVGIDALGRDADFDPSSDSIVRVQANRLRQAIDAHYDGEGASDPVRITVPKGSYRPRFEHFAITSAPLPEPEAMPEPIPGPVDSPAAQPVPAEAPPSPRAPVLPRLALLGGLGVGAAALAAFLLWPTGDGKRHMDHTPVIDIRPFDIAHEDTLAPTIHGMREQLVVDLAHLGTVEIRDFGLEPMDPALAPSDYNLTGSTPRDGDEPRLLLKLRATGDGNVVWSKTLDLPQNDQEFYSVLRDVVGAIAVELAGKQGVVPGDIIRRFDLRVEALGRIDTSEYECLLTAYTYDLTKDARAQEKAATCLTELTDAGSSNSSIWAEHSLVTFLSAEVTEDVEVAQVMGKALAAARTAVRLDPYNAIAREQLGTMFSVLANRDGAIAEFRRGLELAPAKPSIYWQLGWQTVLSGDWDEGMMLVRKGVRKSPFAPGWMRVPLALDAFRRGDYAASLEISKAVIQLGDKRGLPLAFAAAAAMDDRFAAGNYLAQMRLEKGFDGQDPFRAVRRSFSNPSIMVEYDRVAQDSGLL